LLLVLAAARIRAFLRTTVRVAGQAVGRRRTYGASALDGVEDQSAPTGVGKPLLPDSFSVSGSIDLSDTAITALPENLSVGGDLDFNNTPSKRFSKGSRLAV
jgi:hypothetical protein